MFSVEHVLLVSVEVRTFFLNVIRGAVFLLFTVSRPNGAHSAFCPVATYVCQGAVGWLVEALCHKTGGSRLDSLYSPWKFSSDPFLLSAFSSLQQK